jgi:hypothetical protein
LKVSHEKSAGHAFLTYARANAIGRERGDEISSPQGSFVELARALPSARRFASGHIGIATNRQNEDANDQQPNAGFVMRSRHPEDHSNQSDNDPHERTNHSIGLGQELVHSFLPFIQDVVEPVGPRSR